MTSRHPLPRLAVVAAAWLAAAMSIHAAPPAGAAPADASSSTASREDGTREAIGVVKTVSGRASLRDGAQLSPAQPGSLIRTGMQLETGDDGRIGATLKDNSIFSIGPSSRLGFDEFRYAPAQGALRLAASLAHGTLYYVCGEIGRLGPDAVAITTPAGLLKPQHSRLLARVNDGPAASPVVASLVDNPAPQETSQP